MSYDEDEEVEDEFKVAGADGEEALDIPEMNDADFGLDEEDPDKDK